jgi:ergothioneine biosynthesis protein EgtB
LCFEGCRSTAQDRIAFAIAEQLFVRGSVNYFDFAETFASGSSHTYDNNPDAGALLILSEIPAAHSQKSAPNGAPVLVHESSPETRLERLRADFHRVRAFTKHLAKPLEIEDYVVQTMDDVSPTKWHLAHTSWFFEVFVLQKYKSDYQFHHPDYPFLFNSYYVQAGERHCRDRRGYISRPTVAEVYDYRAYVDEQMETLLDRVPGSIADELASELSDVVEIGINHEQQHQELILTDIKHVLSVNPLRPVYSEVAPENSAGGIPPLEWAHFAEGIYEIGHAGNAFCYDNETPRHRHFLTEFLLANRLVTNGDFLNFMSDGGYERPELWLSEGWAAVQENEWREPFYWELHDGHWWMFTLSGMREVALHEPVCHLSYFEADAFARWSDARLPTEQEWEIAARMQPIQGEFAETGRFHPVSARNGRAKNGEVEVQQMYGDVWEWTRSQYSPYPGYKPLPGALGEYNGKFMCNQFVLRGGSCATSGTHIRSTYRNFFPPAATWQFTGLRLAKDV